MKIVKDIQKQQTTSKISDKEAEEESCALQINIYEENHIFHDVNESLSIHKV